MSQLSFSKPGSTRFAITAIGLGAALSLAACASTPIDPTLSIKAAEQAIATADQTRVADTSSPELAEAREKLAASQSAASQKKPVEAERLALESRVTAELASARIEAAKANAVNEEIKRSTAALAQEMQRNSGAEQ